MKRLGLLPAHIAAAALTWALHQPVSAAIHVLYESPHRAPQTLDATEVLEVTADGTLRIRALAEIAGTLAVSIRGGSVEGEEITARDAGPFGQEDLVDFQGLAGIGADLSIPVPRNDGRYVASVTLKDSEGQVQENHQYNFNVDGSPPTMEGGWNFRNFGDDKWHNARTSQDCQEPWMTSTDEGRHFLGWVRATGIRDDGSGISDVRLVRESPEESDDTVIAQSGYDVQGQACWSLLSDPALRDDLRAGRASLAFIVTDKAGNTARFSSKAAEEDPDNQKEGAESCSQSAPAEGPRPMGQDPGEQPRIEKVDVVVSGATRMTWDRNDTSDDKTNPAASRIIPMTAAERLDRVIVSVSHAPHDQTVSVGPDHCVVTAGQSECEIALAHSRLSTQADATRSMVSWDVTLSDVTTPESPVDRLTLISIWDNVKPDVEAIAISDDASQLTLALSKWESNAAYGLGLLTTAWVEAKAENGTTTTIHGNLSRRSDGQWQAQVELNSLEEGTYNILAFCEDAHGNRSRGKALRDLSIDRTRPAVALKVGDESLAGRTISSLQEITLETSDNPGATVEVWGIVEGGPEQRRLVLPAVQDGARLRPGFGPIVPSGQSEDYRLTVKARDERGNESEATAAFTYEPPRFALENGQRIVLPNIPVHTRTAQGQWPMTTVMAVGRWSGGIRANGQRNLVVSLSEDATVPLRIEQQVLSPGASVTLENYDFQASNGQVVLRISPHSRAPAPGYAGLLSLQIQDDAFEGLATPVFLVNASNAMSTAATLQGEFEGVASLAVTDASLCAGGITVLTGTEESLPGALKSRAEGDRECAAQWQPSDSAGGNPGYQPGFLVWDSSAAARFHASGPSQTISIAAQRKNTHSILPMTKNVLDRGWLAVSGWPWDEWGEAKVLVTAERASPGKEEVPPRTESTGSSAVDLEQDAEKDRFCYPSDPPSGNREAWQRLCLHWNDSMNVLAVAAADQPSGSHRTVLNGWIGSVSEHGNVMNDAEQGTWTISIESADGRALAKDASNGPEGTWHLELDELPTGPLPVKVIATKHEESSSTCQARLEAFAELMIENTSPVETTVAMTKERGIQGAGLTLSASVKEERLPDVGGMQWEIQEEHGEWEEIPGATSAALHVLDPPNNAQRNYRVRTRNAFSGELYTSQPLSVTRSGWRARLSLEHETIQAGDIPEIHAEPDPSVEVNSLSWQGWHPLTATTLDLGEGESPRSTPLDEPGNWFILATEKGSKDGPLAWTSVRVRAPLRPVLNIEGPVVVESGTLQSYQATVSWPSPPADDQKGEVVWMFPDGTTQRGLSAQYVAKDGDARIQASYQNARGKELALADLPLEVWSYRWPSFELASRIQDSDGDWVGTYAVTTREVRKAENIPVTYEWSFAPGAEATGDGAQRTVRFQKHAERWVRVLVKDLRGNEQLLVSDAGKAAMGDLELSIDVKTDDKWNRAPTRAETRWELSGRAPGERVVGLRVWLNGALAEEGMREAYELELRHPGLFQVDAEVQTSAGRMARASQVIEVVKHEPPKCEVRLNGDWKTKLQAKANCLIPRGEIGGYRWTLEYDAQGDIRDFGVRGSSIELDASHMRRGARALRMTAFDDRGKPSNEVVRTRDDNANIRRQR